MNESLFFIKDYKVTKNYLVDATTRRKTRNMEVRKREVRNRHGEIVNGIH